MKDFEAMTPTDAILAHVNRKLGPYQLYRTFGFELDACEEIARTR